MQSPQAAGGFVSSTNGGKDASEAIKSFPGGPS